MKKVFYAFAILATVAVAFSACKKDNGNKKEDNKIVKRVTMCGDKWDKYYITYNEDGTVQAVQRNYDEAKKVWEKEWLFTWNGKNATAVYKEGGEKKGSDDAVFTFGDNGYLSSFANHWTDTWTFTYDNGYLKNIKYKGNDKCNCVWENGNLVKWSRIKDSGEEEWKIQTFKTDENVAGIFPDATDKADVQRWMFEVGFLGKASKNLLDEAAWDGAENVAVQTYEKDEDGFVTVVSKVYGTDDPEIYYYEWENVKKK